MNSIPWQFTDLDAVEFGSPLTDATKVSLGLQSRGIDEDGCETWETHDGDLSVLTCRGLIGLINRFSHAHVNSVDLIGCSVMEITELLGRPTKVDSVADSFDYSSHGWQMDVGFSDGRSVWVMIMSNEMFE